MNKHILIAMDHENRSKEELKKNRDAAADAARAAADAAASRAAAYFAADAAYYAADAIDVECWLNKYFEETSDDREEYEKVLEER